MAAARPAAMSPDRRGEVRPPSRPVSFVQRGEPGWPAYDLERRAATRFDTPAEVVDDPRTANRELWQLSR
jgi:carboxylesterase type B